MSEAIEVAELVKVYKKSVWIDSDVMGSRHVMVQHECDERPFCYCSFHYDYAHTDNASTMENAQRVATMLGGSHPFTKDSKELEPEHVCECGSTGWKGNCDQCLPY